MSKINSLLTICSTFWYVAVGPLVRGKEAPGPGPHLARVPAIVLLRVGKLLPPGQAGIASLSGGDIPRIVESVQCGIVAVHCRGISNIQLLTLLW